jgi:hypothetical protein
LLPVVCLFATHHGVATPDEAVTKMHAWNQRKRRFTPHQIRLAWGLLREKGWIHSDPSDPA